MASLRSPGCWWKPERCWPHPGTSRSPAPFSAAPAVSKHQITSVQAAEAANSAKAKATPSMHLVFASTLLPDVQSDTMSLLFGADQVHVVGHEEFASTGYRGPPRRYEGGGTEVGRPLFLSQLKNRERNFKKSLHPNLDAPEGRLRSDWLQASNLLCQCFVFSSPHRRETSP